MIEGKCSICGKDTYVNKKTNRPLWYRSELGDLICSSCKHKIAGGTLNRSGPCTLCGATETCKYRGTDRWIKRQEVNGIVCCKCASKLTGNLKLEPSVRSSNGKKSRQYENTMADRLAPNYDSMFLPQEICDRIVIKDGKVYFLEIKQANRPLTAKQKQFASLVDNYIIVRDKPI